MRTLPAGASFLRHLEVLFRVPRRREARLLGREAHLQHAPSRVEMCRHLRMRSCITHATPPPSRISTVLRPARAGAARLSTTHLSYAFASECGLLDDGGASRAKYVGLREIRAEQGAHRARRVQPATGEIRAKRLPCSARISRRPTSDSRTCLRPWLRVHAAPLMIRPREIDERSFGPTLIFSQ